MKNGFHGFLRNFIPPDISGFLKVATLRSGLRSNFTLKLWPRRRQPNQSRPLSTGGAAAPGGHSVLEQNILESGGGYRRSSLRLPRLLQESMSVHLNVRDAPRGGQDPLHTS